jgi:hypothetical protein
LATSNADCVVANLRIPNQYVLSSLGDAFARIQRTDAPHGMLDSSSVLGTSSFGMGGTNAYASVRPTPGSGGTCRSTDNTASTLRDQNFHRSFWPLPKLNINVLRRDGISKEWSIVLLRPGASALLDHRIGGRVLVPGALWLDTAISCQRMSIEHEPRTHAVTNATFKAPHLLSESDVASATFSLKLDLATGVTAVQSVHRGSGICVFECTNVLMRDASVVGRRSDAPVRAQRVPAFLPHLPDDATHAASGIASVTQVSSKIEDSHMVDHARLDAYLHLPAAASSFAFDGRQWHGVPPRPDTVLRCRYDTNKPRI